MTLADLARGDTAKLDKIDTRDPGVIRLMILGMVEDITVRMENIAIGGDPWKLVFSEAPFPCVKSRPGISRSHRSIVLLQSDDYGFSTQKEYL